VTKPFIAFFDGRSGAGRASLVYHLASMFSDLNLRVVAADLDPQAHLTSMFLDDDVLEVLWSDGDHVATVFGAVSPLFSGTGDLARTSPFVQVEENLRLVPGDPLLAAFEDEFSQAWSDALLGKERAFRVLSVFFRVVASVVEGFDADLALVDVGPSFGAPSRTALLSASHVVVPLAPDLLSLQVLRNMGPTLRKWRVEWRERLGKTQPTLPPGIAQPGEGMVPVGYVVLQHAVWAGRPSTASGKWAARVPGDYAQYVLGRDAGLNDPGKDSECLAVIKHYRSLVPMTQEARKPVFRLKPGDGAMGAHFQAAQEARRDFENLARAIAQRVGLAIPMF